MRAGISREAAFGVGAVGSDKRCGDRNHNRAARVKRPGRIARWIALVLVPRAGSSWYRIVWGKPFSINMLANRQALEFLFQNPELFTEVGIADGTVFDTYSGKL